MDIIDRLHNCPNCGGTLQDDGTCRFCGSKVYDFVNINFDEHTKTYIRMKVNDKIFILPVIFDIGSLEIHHDDYLYIDSLSAQHMISKPVISGIIEYTVVDDIIIEDTKNTGSEY